jgi:hypothetical protein
MARDRAGVAGSPLDDATLPGPDAPDVGAGLLRVDPVEHAGEVERFWAKVVKGTDLRDCWIWTGAIADDGYGRFAIHRDGRERIVRPHRYAAALVLGVVLGLDDVVEHERCDNPVCVRAELDPATGHVWPSTQADNLRRMGQRARGGGAWWQWRWSATDRATLAARSRAQREAVRHTAGTQWPCVPRWRPSSPPNASSDHPRRALPPDPRHG